MVDTPTSGLRLRDMEQGTQLNQWGDLTDTNLAIVDRAMTAAVTLTISASSTVTFTDYSDSNTYLVATLKLTGPSGDNTLTSACTLTMPNVRWKCDVYNVTGQDISFKTAAGATVIVKNGYQARLQCDATDMLLRTSSQFATGLYVGGKIENLTAGTSATDAVNKTQMETAIATLLAGTVTGLALVSSSDTTASYLNSKITVSGSLTKSVVNPGVNETLNIDYTGSVFDAGQTAYYNSIYGV